MIDKSIFRAYDIRGIVGEALTPEVVHTLGLAIGSQALSCGEQEIIVARDGRMSSPPLADALIQGLMATGCDVLDIGAVPTPLLYFATHISSARSGVMVTGSHNPSHYNGLKIVIAQETLSEEDIQNLYNRAMAKQFSKGCGRLQYQDVIETYIQRIVDDVHLSKSSKIVIDAGNGIAGAIAPRLFEALGCHVVPLFCEVDGRFPNHHPDPGEPENLHHLIAAVHEHQADIGLAFDGDGDRLGVVTDRGEIIWPDRQMIVLAQDILTRQKGAKIIFDVKCTRHLANAITQAGGEPVMWKTGHSLIKRKMREMGALLAGEMSGHLFFKERWYGFDDALYAGARLLEILSKENGSSSEIFAKIPNSINTPELKIAMTEAHKSNFLRRLLQEAVFEDAEIITLDGLRVNFKDGWGLIRSSNTTPNLTLRFEADNPAALERIQHVFRQQLLFIDERLILPF